MIILCAFVHSIGTLYGVYSNNRLNLFTYQTYWLNISWQLALEWSESSQLLSAHLSYQFPCLSISLFLGFTDLNWHFACSQEKNYCVLKVFYLAYFWGDFYYWIEFWGRIFGIFFYSTHFWSRKFFASFFPERTFEAENFLHHFLKAEIRFSSEQINLI